ncbi:leukotoxin LktA family filamentous adhesin [Ectopseudomonas mendocina]|uniref:Leukotoxin LktA family filamentous adhesin n=1 Tax=Ectopseudomonas mendocina TaxID=300 RepID=A0ABZ2RHY7_ECTME
MSVKSRSKAVAPSSQKKGASFEDFRPSQIATALAVALGSAPVWAVDAGVTNISLSTQGSTGTNIATSGAVTNITTTTVKGSTGFNSFGTFEVGQGNTVNLHVPSNANNLVNLVHDSKTVINGTLNGLKDGKIGGNIIFADPHGMVVGASGVVNVGTLTVTTPSNTQMQEMAAVINRSNNAAEADKLAADIMAGKYIGGTGEVKIEGKVNSAGSVNLFAANAIITDTAAVNAGAKIFNATVNTAGLVDATAAVRQDGIITIVGKSSAYINGDLQALMADGAGGDVVVSAPDLEVDWSGKIITRADDVTKTSGNIDLQAYTDQSFVAAKADGSKIDNVADLKAEITRQSASKNNVAKIKISSNAELNAGHSVASSAGNITLEARAVEKQSGGYARADASIEIAGILTGKNITAHSEAIASIESGLLKSLFSDVELTAIIDKVKAADSTLDDASAAQYVYAQLVDALATVKSIPSTTSLADFSEFISILPYATFAVADASSRVTVASTANIAASADLMLAADATRHVDTANFSLPIITSKLPFNAGIAYGRLSGETKVEVVDAARLTSEDLSVQAHSQNTLKIEGTASTTRDGTGVTFDPDTKKYTAPSNSTTWSAAFSMAHTDLTTIASVARNANLAGVKGDVTVNAITEQLLSNKASSKSTGQGAVGGPGVALALYNSDTFALFNADLINANSLSVNAVNMVAEQSNTAMVQAGKGFLDSLQAKILSQADFKAFTTSIGDYIKSHWLGKKILPEGKLAPSELRVGSAVAVSIADHQVEARIGGGSLAQKQNITLRGDMAVTALQQQRSLHNTAESSVLADQDNGDGTARSVSVAVSYNQLTQKTRALIGNHTAVEAAHIGVAARNVQSLDFAGLDRWNSLGAVFDNLTTHVPALVSIPGKIGTSYANSNTEGEEAGIAGSVSSLVTNIDAEAWVGDYVTLTATASGNDWYKNPFAYLPKLYDEDGNEDKARKALREFALDWDSAVDIGAVNHIQQLGISGNIALLLFGSSSGGTAVGGNVNVQVTNNNASAGIGANSTIKAKRVDVTALQEELIIGVSPSAGKGVSTAGNGSIVVSAVNSDVNASIHNSTRVEADQVGIKAEHQLGLWTAAGALAISDETGVGAGIALNVVNTDIQALVGDNRGLRNSDNALGAGVAGNGRATWLADEVLVNADSNGQVGAFSIAGAVARTADETAEQKKAQNESGDQGLVDSVAGIGQGLLQAITGVITGDAAGVGKAGLLNSLTASKNAAGNIKDAIVDAPGKIKSVLEGLLSDEMPGNSQTKQSIAFAGSGSINVVGQKTRAHLGDIVLDPRTPSAGSKVTVLSLNHTNQLSGSGAGAITLVGTKKAQSSAGIAGAMAYNHLFNVTEAHLKNVTLNNNDLLKVQAASAGDQVAMGLGLAVATAGQSNTAVSMSVSGGVITNTTSALVLDSVINQRVAESQGIAVNAYDRSRTLLGGGSFSLATGGQGSATSAGGSLVLAVQKNSLTADWLGSTATGFKRLDVSANTAARVLAGAVAVAVTTGQDGTSGSGAIAVVVVDNDVRAKVDKSDKGNSSLIGGEVNVKAQSVAGMSALDGVFKQAGLTALSHTGLDLDGSETAGQINGKMDTEKSLFDEDGAPKTQGTDDHLLFSGPLAGEAVLAIAGNVAASSGKNSVGGAVSIVYTGSDYTASVANSTVDLTGDLNVSAANSTTVLSAAIGAAGSKENAVSGSSTAVIGRGRINANVDMTGKTLTANNLTVTATKGGGAYSLAGNIAVGMNNAAVGGAISINDMEQTAAATVQNGTYSLLGDATIAAAMQSKIMAAALSGQGSADGSAIGGALSYTRIDDTTRALLTGATLTGRDLFISASQPDLGASIKSVAFNISAAGGQAGVGGAVAVNLLLAERSARLTNSDVSLTGSASLKSSLDGEIWGVAVDAAGGKDVGAGGSIVVNVIDGEDEVLVDNSRLVSSGPTTTLSLDAASGNGLKIASLAGSVKGGGQAAVGGAISVNRIGANRTALIRNAREISGFSNTTLNSGAKQAIYAIAIAGGGSGKVAVMGSSTSNVLQGTERSAIENSTVNVGALSLSSALGDRTIWSLAGAFAGGGKVAVGAANTNNIILSKRLAEVIGGDLTIGGALTLASGGSANIRSAAVAGGGGGTAAVGGSIAINVVDGEERAEIKGAVVKAGSVSVDVTRGKTDIKTLAGTGQGAGTAGVGASIAVSTINQKRTARIVDSTLTLGAGNATVKAHTNGNILTLAVAGVGGGSAGVAVANTSNNIAAKTTAEVVNSGGTAGKLEILASDTSAIQAGSAGFAGAGTAAVGVGTAINRVDSEIKARLTGNLASGWALTNLRLDANSAANIIAGFAAGGGAGAAGVATVAATNIIQTLTEAYIAGGAKVVAQNNIAVSARNVDSILGSAAVGSGAGTAAVSALVTVNVVETNTKAYISGAGTQVSALGKSTTDTMLVDSGELNNAPSDSHEWFKAEQFNPYPNLSIKQHHITGLAVQASSIQQVGQIVLSASVAVTPLASAAVSGVINTTVLGGSTLGYIDAAQINQVSGAGAAQNVRVGANSHSYTAGYLGAVAAGPTAASVAGAVDNVIISRQTQARLNDVTLASKGKTEVLAGSNQYASTIIASIAGGIVAPGVSSSVVILKGDTDARISGTSQLDVGSLKVSANAKQSLAPNAVSIGGGGVAVGGAVVTLYNQSITRAWIGKMLSDAAGTRINIFSGNTEISATNSTDISLKVASAGGGGVAVAGSIGVTVVETTTEAGASQVNFGSEARKLGNLTITAKDTLKVRNNVGSAAVGSSSYGASANVLVANSGTRALFDRSALHGSQFNLKALREGDVVLNTVTGSVGMSSGLGGSLGLLLLGSGAASVSAGGQSYNALDELNKGGNGSLSQSDKLAGAGKTGDLTYDDYQWNETTQQYELVSKTDKSTQDRVNGDSNKASLGDRLSASSTRKHETLAKVSGSTIDTSGASTIVAEDKLYSRNLTGAAVGGGSAVGGAFGLTLSNARVNAELSGGSLKAASLDISAKSGNLNSSPAVEVHSLSGTAGFSAALGASVGAAVLNNQINVALNGAVTTTGLLKALAEDKQSIKVQALGAAAGLGAGAGLVLGVAAHDSVVKTSVGAGTQLKSGGNLQLDATSQGPVELIGRGAAGGLGAGVNASILLARDKSTAIIDVGQNAVLNAANALSLTATASPKVKASSLGIALGGYLSAGATVADALAKATAKVSLGSAAVLTAKSADIFAHVGRQDGASSALVDALGVSGGIGISANAVVARAVNESSSLVESTNTTRFVGTGGDWALRAASEVHQRAKTTGYAGGLLTVGAHVAEALSTTTTQALINGVFDGNIKLLNVSATSTVDNEARSQSGQGGLVSGAASIANTRDDGTTRAQLFAVGAGSDTIARFAGVDLSALHTSNFNAFVDSINASLIGASGAHAKNKVTLTTESLLLANSKILTEAYEQSATSKVVKAASTDYNVKSGSGGVLNAAAALSESTISMNTLSRVGSGAIVDLSGDFREPQHLKVSAFNDVFARDRVKLDSGGAIAIAKADSKVDVTRASAVVDIETNAQLESIGDIIISASGKYDIDTHSAGKTWGLAGAAMGQTLARVVANYDVNVKAGSTLLGYGDVKLYAGQDLAGGSNQARLVAITDLWNNTAFPVTNDPGADARYQRNAQITVAAGANVNSVGDVYVHADKGYGNLTGKGVAKDLYTEALNAVGLAVERTGGSSVNVHTAVATLNGNINSGYLNNRFVTINGLTYWVNGQEKTLQELAQLNLSKTDKLVVRPSVTTSDDKITYRLTEGTYSQFITARIEQINKNLTNYGISPIEKTAMEAERNLLQVTLNRLYQEMGGNGTGSIAKDHKIYIFQLDQLLAKPGNVRVVADSLVGSGKLRAPGDASIKVVNNSSAFLDIRGLEIPYHEGGQLLFNNTAMTSLAQINAANRQTGAAFNLQLSASSAEPVISVINTYNPATGVVGADGMRAPAPDIYINGRLFNQRGLVSVTAAYGSIYSNADIRGKTVEISSGRDFVLNSDSPFYHVGGDPAGSTGTTLSQPTKSTVAANNVVISAQHLNINGTIQSGAASWKTTIGTDLAARIDQGRKTYKATGKRYLQLVSSDVRNGILGYSYDYLTESLVMDSVEVAGGYMELSGHIMSTGNGQLKVLDGFSQVEIVNNSGYKLNLNTLDLGMKTHGTLRLNDVRTVSGKQVVWSTVYTRDFDAGRNSYVVNMRQGYSQDIDTAAKTYVTTGRDTTFNPVAGRGYVWLTGQKQTTTTVETWYKDKVWGLFPSGDGTLWSRDVYTDPVKVPIDGADYMSSGYWGTPGQIAETSTTYNDGTPNVETSTWTTCEAWFLWCHEKRSWLEETTVQGERIINRHEVRADRPINISFIGSDTGLVNVTSNTEVTLLGSILNPTGTVNITSGGSLLQNADHLVISAKDLNLKAATGIGSDGKAVSVQVGNNLSASTTVGDLNLSAIGNVNLAKLESGRGNISLSALGNITAANGTTVKGYSINLQSAYGSIGASNKLLNIDSGYASGAMSGVAALTAGASGGIFLNETSGDLAVNRVIAGGDIHLKVAAGDLIDANSTLTYDTRTLEQLQALWSDMALTGTAAEAALAEQKQILIDAGQRSYERYWQMRTGANGLVQVFDESQALLSASQIAQLKEMGWTDAQVDQEQLRRAAEYNALHDRFGMGTGYDASFKYQLSATESAMLESTASWTPEQLQFSISSALLNRGTNTQVKVEELNIEGNNVTLEANRIGRVLDADVLVDLSVGIENLTTAQLAALAAAEHDDVYFDDPNDKTKLRIVQRDDINLAARGNLSVTAVGDVFLGGERDLNLYNVKGDTIHIKTNGSIESANGQNIVLKGNDVLLEASSGAIGGKGSLNIEVKGDLTARAQTLNLTAHGDLNIQRLIGLNGLNLKVVGGNLYSSSQMGENLLGGNINLTVSGNVGTFTDRVQLGTSGLGQQIVLDIDGNAYLGGLQGAASAAGTLNFGAVSVDGLLDIAQTRDLLQYANWSLGSLALALSNQWTMASGTNLTTANGIFARVADTATLGNVFANNTSGNIDIQARLLSANAAGQSWKAGNLLTLLSHGDIGSQTWKVGVAGREVDITSSQGALYLMLLNGTLGGSLTSALGQFLTSAGNVALDSVTSRTDKVELDGSGNVSIDTLSAQLDLDLSGANLALGTANTAQGDVLVDVSGAFSADELHSATKRVQVKAGGAQLGNVSAATTLNIHTTANALRIGTGISGGNMELTTAAGSLANIHFGPLANPSTPNVLVPTHLSSGANLLIRADGDVLGGNAEANGLLEIFGRNVTFGRVQSWLGDVFLQATGNAQQGHGNITGLKVDADGSVSIIGDGTLTIDNVEFGGTYTLRAGNDLNVGLGGDLNITGIAEAGRDLTFNVGGMVDLQGIQAGRNVVVNSGAGVNLTEGVQAGGAVSINARNGNITIGTGINSTGSFRGNSVNSDVQLTATGDIRVPTITTANGQISANGQNLSLDDLSASANVGLQAAGLIRVGTSRSGGDQSWQAAQDINLTQLQAGGTVSLTARGGDINVGTGIQSSGLFGGAATLGNVLLNASGDISAPVISAANGRISANGLNLSLGDLSASADVDLLARGAIRVNNSRSGGAQNWYADDEIFFERLLATGQVMLDSLLDTRGTELASDQAVTVRAGWRDGVASDASILIDEIRAPSISLWSGRLIRVGNAGIGQSLDLHAQDIELYGQHTGAGQLNLNITGSANSIADRLVLGLQANQVLIPYLHATDIQLQTGGDQLEILDAQGVQRMRLQTSQAVVLMNNAGPAYLNGADVQLYEPDGAFSFSQNQLTSTTNAYVLHRAFTHQVLLPNFMEDHEGNSGLLYQGMTAARYSEQFVSREYLMARLASLLSAAALRVPGGGWVANWQQQPASMRINLNMPEKPSTSEEVSKWEI